MRSNKESSLILRFLFLNRMTALSNPPTSRFWMKNSIPDPSVHLNCISFSILGTSFDKSLSMYWCRIHLLVPPSWQTSSPAMAAIQVSKRSQDVGVRLAFGWQRKKRSIPLPQLAYDSMISISAVPKYESENTMLLFWNKKRRACSSTELMKLVVADRLDLVTHFPLQITCRIFRCRLHLLGIVITGSNSSWKRIGAGGIVISIPQTTIHETTNHNKR